ncbi:hypothetical protein HK104_008279 [Borealophlyctis nickersoniae]|nr:hypothetical protein HK104_008279 [Borealophlyctis nickersoniae]
MSATECSEQEPSSLPPELADSDQNSGSKLPQLPGTQNTPANGEEREIEYIFVDDDDGGEDKVKSQANATTEDRSKQMDATQPPLGRPRSVARAILILCMSLDIKESIALPVARIANQEDRALKILLGEPLTTAPRKRKRSSTGSTKTTVVSKTAVVSRKLRKIRRKLVMASEHTPKTKRLQKRRLHFTTGEELPGKAYIEVWADASFRAAVQGGYRLAGAGCVFPNKERSDIAEILRVNSSVEAEIEAAYIALLASGNNENIRIFVDCTAVLYEVKLWLNAAEFTIHTVVEKAARGENPRYMMPAAMKLVKLVRNHVGKIEWNWCKGHEGNVHNNTADRLAGIAAQAARGKVDANRVVMGFTIQAFNTTARKYGGEIMDEPTQAPIPEDTEFIVISDEEDDDYIVISDDEDGSVEEDSDGEGSDMELCDNDVELEMPPTKRIRLDAVQQVASRVEVTQGANGVSVLEEGELVEQDVRESGNHTGASSQV